MSTAVPADASWSTYSTALRRLLARPELRSRFQQDLDGAAVAAELRVPEEMLTDLKQTLLLIGRDEPDDPGGPGGPGGHGDGDQDPLSARSFYEATYAHLRRGAVATVVMSVLIFVMGLGLLLVAAWEALTDDSQGGTIALAATGIAAVAAAFYQSPVTQMRASTAEVQRSSMVLMSYMLGMSLVARSLDGQDTTSERETLVALTHALVELLPSGPAA